MSTSMFTLLSAWSVLGVIIFLIVIGKIIENSEEGEDLHSGKTLLLGAFFGPAALMIVISVEVWARLEKIIEKIDLTKFYKYFVVKEK